MRTIRTSRVPKKQVEALARLVDETGGAELRDVLLAVSRCIREGVDLVVFEGDKALTPTQVAQRLGMSRTHLYKLLDRGEIMSHRVGRDRRIRLTDVIAFEEQRQSDRRELAERFEKQHATRDAAIDELVDLL